MLLPINCHLRHSGGERAAGDSARPSFRGHGRLAETPRAWRNVVGFERRRGHPGAPRQSAHTQARHIWRDCRCDCWRWSRYVACSRARARWACLTTARTCCLCLLVRASGKAQPSSQPALVCAAPIPWSIHPSLTADKTAKRPTQPPMNECR